MPGSVVLPHAAVGRSAGACAWNLMRIREMFKRLSVLTRLFVFLLAGTTVLALAVAQFDSSRLPVVPILSLRWDTLSPDRWSRYEPQQGFYLIDRVSGSSNLVPLPEEEQWGLLSVSPW